MKSISIVHIEDEYREFLSLSTTVKTMIEDIWEISRNQSVIAKRRKLAESEDTPQNWVVFEITVDEEPNQKFRYIFVKDASIPPEVTTYFLDERVFILDVLRPIADSTILGISVDESLKSIAPFVKDESMVVLFTAHQGNGLDFSKGIHPKKISKESDGELEEFLGSVLAGCFKNG